MGSVRIPALLTHSVCGGETRTTVGRPRVSNYGFRKDTFRSSQKRLAFIPKKQTEVKRGKAWFGLGKVSSVLR